MAYSVSYLYKVIDKYTTPLARIQRKTKAFERQMMVTNAAMRALDSTILKTKKSVNSYSGSLNKSNAKHIALGQAISQAAYKADTLADKEDKVRHKTDQAVNSLGRMNAKLLTLHKRMSDAKRKMADSGIGRFHKDMQGAGRTLTTRVTLPMAIAGGVAVKTAVGMESAWTGVLKTVDASDEVLFKLNKDLKDLSKIVPTNIKGIFGIAEAAGQLGINAEDIAGFTKVIIDLSETTNLATDQASMELAKFSNVMDVAVKDYDRLGSVIVDLGNNMATTEADIVNMASRLKTAGKLAGMSASDVLSISAALSAIGIKSEEGGSAVSQTIMRISGEIGKGSQKMKGFAFITGKSVAQFEKLWKEDAAEALLQFTEGLAKFEKKTGKPASAALDQLGLDGIRVARALLGAAASGDTFRTAIDRGNAAWLENNALVKEAELRYGTAAAKLSMFKNRMVLMFAAFGDILTPFVIKITELLTPVTEWFEKLNPTAKKVIVTFGLLVATIGPLLITLAGIISSIMMFKAAAALLGVALSPVLAIAGAIAFALIGVGAAAYQIIKHWDALAYEVKNVWEWFSKLLDNPLIVAALTVFAPFISIPALIIKHWKPLKGFLGGIIEKFNAVKEKIPFLGSGGKTPEEKWAEEVAYSNARRERAKEESPMGGRMDAMKGTLNGMIGLKAAPGTEITDAEMETDLPGNLGFNMG